MVLKSRVVTQLFLTTGMEKKMKIRGNIRGFSREIQGNTIKFASITGREIYIENVYQLYLFGSVRKLLI